MIRTRSAHPVVLSALIAAVASATGLAQAAPTTSCTLDRATGTTIDRTPFLRNAYGVNWNFATNRLAYMAPDASGYYRVMTSRADGSRARAIAPALPELRKHQGSPMWDPSGRYILFIAQKPEWHSLRLFGSPDFEALPGFGLHDDMWIMTSDGSQAWRLTSDPNTRTEGILLPVFSHDGRRIAWAARQPDKTYVLRVADFIAAPVPHLANIRSYTPGGRAYYEPGSFTSDGASLIYTSDQDTRNFWLSQIDRLDLATGRSMRLTRGVTYNEHPVVVTTPGGDRIVYMSTQDIHRSRGHLLLGTDWWSMRIDGTDAKRLTTMNAPNSPESTGALQVATRVTATPSGSYVLGDVQDSLIRQTGLVRVVRFTCGE